MAVQLWYLVAFLVYLQYTDAGGSCQENIYLEVGKQGVVPCHFQNFEIIGWINGSGDVRKIPPFIYKEGSQIYGEGYESGDYDMHPNGSLIINEVKLTNEYNYTVLFDPQLAGENEYFKVPVKVYVLPDLGYPVVNGRTNQVIVHGNTRGFINCSMTGIRPSVHLEWVFSQDEISLNNSHRVTDNSDGTYNTYLTSSYKVINSPTGRVSFECRVAGQMADLFPLVTTVYMLLEQPTSMLPVPVIDGCYSQREACTLMMTTEGTITCSVQGVPHNYDLNLDLYTLPDLRCLSLITNRIDTHHSGYYDIITSCRYIVDKTFMDTMVHCFLSGTDRNIQPVNSTVKAKIIWQDQDSEVYRRCKETDQDREGKISRLPTFIAVLLVFLTIEMNLFLLFRSKRKDYVRKFYKNCANPGKQTDLEEAVAADHQSIQEMQPLQPVNNEYIIDVISQNKEILQKCTTVLSLLKKQETPTDSGLSSSPNSSTASEDLTEQEAQNTQNIEAAVC